MKHKTISHHITLLATVWLTISVAVAGVSIVAITGLASSVGSLAQSSLPALGQLAAVEQPLFELRKSIVLAASAKDADEARSYERDVTTAIEGVRRTEAEYNKLPAASSDRALARNFENLLDTLSASAVEIGQLSRQGKKDEALNALNTRFSPAFDSAMDAERHCSSLRLAGASQLAASAGSLAQSSLIAVWSVFGIAATFGVFLCLYSKRRITRDLTAIVSTFEENAGRLTSSVSQVSSSGHALSNGASQQAASIEEISSSAEEMNAMTLRNSENAARASSMMADTSNQIGRSNIALKDMIASMEAIQQSSEKVARINRTIDEIAFQTNILALNAAVEAARAGDAGMGFAVVADEVRNLAQRSAVAAKDTALLIEEAIENTRKGSRNLDQVASVIKAITEGAGQVGHLLREVKEASSQQAQGIAQISQAILHVNKITQQSAAGAQESAAASEDLSEQARSIQRGIHSLQALAGFAKSKASEALLSAQPVAMFPKEATASAEQFKKTEPVYAFARPGLIDAEDFLPMDSDAAHAQTFKDF
ncbi:MAG: methyl-accepting chemotaxis protein [Bryobacteraceae bacterium]